MHLVVGNRKRGKEREREKEGYTLTGTLQTDGKMLKDKMLNILLTGHDMTTCMLIFLVFALAEHPVVLDWLRKEVLDVVGPACWLTYEDIREMKYMHTFINEVLRLYPHMCVFCLSVSSGRLF